MRAQQQPGRSQLRRGWCPSRWDLAVLAAAIAAFAVGFFGQWAHAGISVYWKWEQLQAAARDVLFRRSENLPPPATGSRPVPPYVTPVPVTASYEQSVLPAEPTSVVTTSREPAVGPAIRLPEVPRSQQLAGFEHEYQQPNNCGPATLAIAMRYWGWQGTQNTIAAVLKPQLRDKNVRWDELVYYVLTHAGWLDALFRVGGDAGTLERFVSAGIPVIIETGYELNVGWVGHYLVVSGYDRDAEVFTVQDVTGGPDRKISYEKTAALWEQFNHLYVLVFPADKRVEVLRLLGEDEQLDANRYRALRRTRAGTEANAENAFAWFTYGSNLNYFGRYSEAAVAFDRAREIGLPWRMLFYQFGPYIAYFNVGRYQDVIDLATAMLQARPALEESYVWRGWALHMLGDTAGARSDFRAALGVNPNFVDALTALNVVGK
ncbi:MAG: C39 family peptidase [Anaerolineales bacterium]|jgi:hypothetical protein|nr:C39 family peptidase [Anaerolineales bacterium]